MQSRKSWISVIHEIYIPQKFVHIQYTEYSNSIQELFNTEFLCKDRNPKYGHLRILKKLHYEDLMPMPLVITRDNIQITVH